MFDPMQPLAAGASYLMGSIPCAYLAVKYWKKVDIRTVGSGNVGATNAGRILGRRAAILIYLFDAGKGVGSVYLSKWLVPDDITFEVLCGFLAIVGHVFPVWLKFKGGKGVATTTGVFLALHPLAMAIAGAVWIAAAAATRFVSIASIALAVAFPLAVICINGMNFSERGQLPIFSFGAATAIFVIYKHRANVARVLAGTEPRIFTKK